MDKFCVGVGCWRKGRLDQGILTISVCSNPCISLGLGVQWRVGAPRLTARSLWRNGLAIETIQCDAIYLGLD
jgi:hypothetical protein